MKAFRVLAVFVLALAMLPFAPAAGSSDSATYIVSLRRDRDPEATAREHSSRYGVKAERYFRSVIKGYVAELSEDRAAALREDPSVLTVSRNRTFRATVGQETPTGVKRIAADTVPETGESVYVAVMDSGIDYQHPDLAANVAGGVDCDGADTGNFDDQQGHGTHVAGTIAAIDNTIGVVGVAPAVKLYAVRILDAGGNGTDVTILCGLEWIYNRAPLFNGVIRVANMSLEASFPNIDDNNCGYTIGDPVHQGICAVVDAGVTFVVAAGNGNQSGTPVNIKDVAPAAYDEVITVTALADYDGKPCSVDPTHTDDDTFASFSNFATLTADKAHTIAAPGVDIFSTWRLDQPGNPTGYAFLDGTSMASPHVAGLVARYLHTHPGAPTATVLQALLAPAEPVDVDVNDECGGGGVFSHTDPTGKHAEPVVRVADWSIPLEASGPGIVRGNTWFLNNGFDSTGDVPTFAYGNPSDRIVVGDWDGDGVDSPGVVRGNVWYLNNALDATGDVPTFAYGNPSDRVVVGDWDGDDVDSPGVVRGNVWYLNNEFDATGDVPIFAFGRTTDRVVVGDWDGDVDHVDTPGVVRGNVWFFNNGFDAFGDSSVAFGRSTDEPLVGNWDGDEDDDIAVRRGTLWYLRLPIVFSFTFGRSTDRAVTGDWDGLTP